MSNDPGLIETTGDTRSLRFERRFPYPSSEAWSALTEPSRLGDWFTTAESMRGRVALPRYFGEHGVCGGAITACDPPRVLEYEWRFPDGPSSLVHWELHDQDGRHPG